MKILTNIIRYYYPINAKIHYDDNVTLIVVAQEDNKPSCTGCFFSDSVQEKRHKKIACYIHGMSCTAHTRKDKKHVIFSESV